ncbi:hypothetical protein CFT12S00416_07945 [Campylobacter fetus subsp. testudinum]|uniref:hypothetical protein n=1 Tax=Campylobacter fetus TaxID=196 RepID=UPI000818ACA3|nr:hypothetical protein [Campylobacter fetus]OCR87749.1 hypothetical protein CFT12S00416_07945 [Campylobacter fetus subsp. testudinum]OCR99075.1 hypothetical protein A9K75_08490 [Campylobacter fetus subsp. testudinum]
MKLFKAQEASKIMIKDKPKNSKKSSNIKFLIGFGAFIGIVVITGYLLIKSIYPNDENIKEKMQIGQRDTNIAEELNNTSFSPPTLENPFDNEKIKKVLEDIKTEQNSTVINIDEIAIPKDEDVMLEVKKEEQTEVSENNQISAIIDKPINKTKEIKTDQKHKKEEEIDDEFSLFAKKIDIKNQYFIYKNKRIYEGDVVENFKVKEVKRDSVLLQNINTKKNKRIKK